MNHLEQLVGEWYEYQGYFVRRNVWVGPRKKGGYECELDVVAFHPSQNHLVHIEPSMDANPWEIREERYKKKFAAGNKYIPRLFKGIKIPQKPDQIALLGFAGRSDHKTLGGGRILLIRDLLAEIISELSNKKIGSKAVSEQWPLIRTLQFVAEHQKEIFKS